MKMVKIGLGFFAAGVVVLLVGIIQTAYEMLFTQHLVDPPKELLWLGLAIMAIGMLWLILHTVLAILRGKDPFWFFCAGGGMVYTSDLKSLAFGLAGSSPALRTILGEEG